MTTPKHSIALPARTPAFVSRETGAAELSISPETWDTCVAAGVLPPPDTRLTGALPRWKWATVLAWLKGERDHAKMPANDPYIRGAEGVRHGPAARKRHA